jgi:hypothetical protein
MKSLDYLLNNLYISQCNQLNFIAMKSRYLSLVFVSLVSIFLFTDFWCKSEDPEDSCKKDRMMCMGEGEMLVDGAGMWQLSVADKHGAILVADKNCHAEMTLKFWFLDPELAKTNAKPPVSVSFHGGGGFFDPGQISTYVVEKTDGTYYWTAFMSAAAKNAETNPVDYVIFVTWDYDQLLELKDVGLSASIDYKEYKEPTMD